MQRISITNPQNVIDGTAKKYYFRLRNTGGPKGDKGDKGDTGATGPQGPQGNAATVSVGSTTTLPVGYDATVTNTGSIYNAVLDFGIPQGPQGPQGAKGDKGDTGAKGDTGPRGPQGEKGTNATVYVGTTSTLAPGSQATVYNSGSDSNAVLNFGIPQGAKGDTGNQGPAGQNFAPTVVAELPATGDESKLYLTPKAHTSQTATGNPITATVAEEAGAIESFQLDGDTYQQSYTGKNLFNKNTAKIAGGYISGSAVVSGYQDPITNQRDRLAIVPCLPNTTYTITKPATPVLSKNRFRIGTSEDAPVDGSKLNDYWNAGDGTSTATHTFTTSPTANWLCIFYGQTEDYDPSNILQTVLNGIQLELGSTATAYEPFVGGQPSPSPSYPRQIQTVTGLQTVEIVGKNLFDKDDVVNGIPSASDGSIVSTTSIGRTSRFIRVKSSTDYSHTGHPNGWATIAWYKADESFISRTDNATTTTSPTEAAFARVSCASTDLNTCQFEEGQPTDYAPYSKQTLPLDLGSIELCKITYSTSEWHDYIYKDGDDWKVHKATTTKIFSGADSEGWVINNSGTENFFYRCPRAATGTYGTPDNSRYLYCNYESGAQVTSSNTANGVFVLSGGDVRLRYGTEMSLDNWKAKLAATNMVLTYALATPTDAIITDSTLIAQLEAVRTASLENGANTISNTATGTNLAGDMEISYYGYNPTNRYDKFIWLDLNNNYEQIGE